MAVCSKMLFAKTFGTFKYYLVCSTYYLHPMRSGNIDLHILGIIPLAMRMSKNTSEMYEFIKIFHFFVKTLIIQFFPRIVYELQKLIGTRRSLLFENLLIYRTRFPELCIQKNLTTTYYYSTKYYYY